MASEEYNQTYYQEPANPGEYIASEADIYEFPAEVQQYEAIVYRDLPKGFNEEEYRALDNQEVLLLGEDTRKLLEDNLSQRVVGEYSTDARTFETERLKVKMFFADRDKARNALGEYRESRLELNDAFRSMHETTKRGMTVFVGGSQQSDELKQLTEYNETVISLTELVSNRIKIMEHHDKQVREHCERLGEQYDRTLPESLAAMKRSAALIRRKIQRAEQIEEDEKNADLNDGFAESDVEQAKILDDRPIIDNEMQGGRELTVVSDAMLRRLAQAATGRMNVVRQEERR